MHCIIQACDCTLRVNGARVAAFGNDLVSEKGEKVAKLDMLHFLTLVQRSSAGRTALVAQTAPSAPTGRLTASPPSATWRQTRRSTCGWSQDKETTAFMRPGGFTGSSARCRYFTQKIKIKSNNKYCLHFFLALEWRPAYNDRIKRNKKWRRFTFLRILMRCSNICWWYYFVVYLYLYDSNHVRTSIKLWWHSQNKKIWSPLSFLNLFSEKSFLLGKARYVEFRNNSVPFLFLFPSCVVSLATAVTRHTLDSLFLSFSCAIFLSPSFSSLYCWTTESSYPDPFPSLKGISYSSPEVSVSRCISGTLWKRQVLVKRYFLTQFEKARQKRKIYYSNFYTNAKNISLEQYRKHHRRVSK